MLSVKHYSWYIHRRLDMFFLDRLKNCKIILSVPQLPALLIYWSTLSPSYRVLNLLKLTSTWHCLHTRMQEGTRSYYCDYFLLFLNILNTVLLISTLLAHASLLKVTRDGFRKIFVIDLMQLLPLGWGLIVFLNFVGGGGRRKNDFIP